MRLTIDFDFDPADPHDPLSQDDCGVTGVDLEGHPLSVVALCDPLLQRWLRAAIMRLRQLQPPGGQ